MRKLHTIKKTSVYTDENTQAGWDARKATIAALSDYLLFECDADFRKPIQLRRSERLVEIDGQRAVECTIGICAD